MSKRAVMTFTTWVWESDEPDTDPTIESGYYEIGWGEMSTDGLSRDEVEEVRNNAIIDFELDKFDIDDDVTVASKVVDFIEEWGLTMETGGEWFSDEPSIIDYATGKYRQLDFHFVEGDWSTADEELIEEEFAFRAANRNAKINADYFAAVKAYV